LKAWVEAPFHRRNYEALWNMLRVSAAFPEILPRYLFGRGAYPYQLTLGTPIGPTDVTLFHAVDSLTLTEVFFREDYQVPENINVAVDVGSNIGISALYFLTRNTWCRCYCFEPDGRNADKLASNLARFSGRYVLARCAISDSSGESDFGLEATGRYGGIGIDSDRVIRVEMRDVNEILEEILALEEAIDVLKVDTEGLEQTIVAAIRPDLLRRIQTIYFESSRPAPALHPGLFEHSRRGQVERLAR
jgi:FkbM family methyltransferase